MKYTFVYKRLWDKYLGKSQAYSNIMNHRCEKTTKMSKKYLLLKKTDKLETDIDCWGTWAIHSTCCFERLARLGCEQGWYLYHSSNSQVDFNDFKQVVVHHVDERKVG
tara:strand:- start:332 stop:655 length:324 start_codon:yes stop_codon:yes gene_type:complete